MMQHHYITYLWHFIGALLLSLSCVVTVNALVDPYDLFDAPKIQGFNKEKAVISSKQRVFETVRVLDRHDEVVILGTSRSDIGISPDHPIFPAGKTFNAAMSGQQISETRQLLEALLARQNQPLKTVIIGLDFFAFNTFMPTPFDFSEENFSPWRKMELLFSISTTLDAFRTVIRQNRLQIMSNGGVVHENGFRELTDTSRTSARERFLNNETGYLRITYNPAPACTWNTHNSQTNHDTYDDFRRILELAHEHALELRLFISPSHARQWETLAAAGLWTNFEEWKRRLVNIQTIAAKQYNRPSFPLWDFSGYNSITTTPLPTDDTMEIKNYWESSHYRKEVGDQIINRIFVKKNGYPSDFGIEITNINLETWLYRTRQLQQSYRTRYKKDMEELSNLAKTVASSGPCAKKQ